jgi:pimeloyl-ACP methyl ester carboxylesterase
MLTALLAPAARAQAPAPTLSLYGLYDRPGELVTIAPRRAINLVCAGRGSPTVVLSAGLAASAFTWVWVQPAVARKTRVCAWDRAGYGFSSPSPEPQDIVHTVADLERALVGAGVTGRLLLVGHSLGAAESLLFADRHPAQVAGVVLVDPSVPDNVERFRRAAPDAMAFSGRSDQAFAKTIARCVSALDARRRDPPPIECVSLRAGLPETVRKGLAGTLTDSAYWATFASSYEERENDAKLAINPKRTLGATPLIVFGAGVLALPGAPPKIQAQIPALHAEIRRGQEELARLSSRGAYVPVPDTGHAIHLQKPQLVIDAIDKMVDEVRAAKP